ncbi:MAG: glycogen/starch synthase [Bacteroidales bacterium]|nr:glycogen/starch synthase [Bacteroidales bacterium]
MSKKSKILFISQEIIPFSAETEMSYITRHLPQGVQEMGKEIRTFMPCYGCINERRGQLHEVIRLSGMNLIMDETDHPLIVKVASIPQARMQVYFIDNDDYYKRKAALLDEEGNLFEDNDERMVFFCRGVLETIKKLSWVPDIIHCHGWFSTLIPLYIKKAFNENPIFSDAKVVLSVYNDQFTGKLRDHFSKVLMQNGIEKKDLVHYKKATWRELLKGAISFSDAFVQASETIDDKLFKEIQETGKPFLTYEAQTDYISIYNNFYDSLLIDENEEKEEQQD